MCTYLNVRFLIALLKHPTRFKVVEVFSQLIEEILNRFSTMLYVQIKDHWMMDRLIIIMILAIHFESENCSSSLYNYHKKSAPSDGQTSSHLTHKSINDSKNTNVLLHIIIRRTNEFVTRATAMELCALSMIAAGDPEPFALQCLRVVLEGARQCF